jgi:hypothetical protein
MTEREPVEVTNLDRYDHAVLPWSRPRDLLLQGTGPETPMFLGTVRPDGRPHAAPIGAVWIDEHFYFTSSPKSRKSRNLAANPFATISVRLPGLDLVTEGEVTRITDAPTLEKVAAFYRDIGWPAEVEGEAFTAPFSAPSAGPPPWELFRFTFHTAFGVGSAEPNGATRWRF